MDALVRALVFSDEQHTHTLKYGNSRHSLRAVTLLTSALCSFAKLETYNQLDYLMLSRHLSTLPANTSTQPFVLRKGLPLRATRYKGARFDKVGQDRPKASDHCPVYMDVELQNEED